MGLENSPSTPRQASSQGPHCPGKSRHCFLPVPPQPRDSPHHPADSTPGLGLGSSRWEAGLREAEGAFPVLHHHPDSGRDIQDGGDVTPGSFLSHRTPPHPWLFPPLQAAGLGREQRLEQGQEAGSGAAGNAGSSGEGGEQGPGLLFHFFWKENWRKNRRRESPPPRPSGNLPWVGTGSGGPWGARAREGG